MIEFEPYPEAIVPLPRPWNLDHTGKVINPELSDLGMQVLTLEDGYVTVSMQGSQYIFPQRVTAVKEIA